MIADERQTLEMLYESLQADRRELDRFAWTVPLAIYGAVGLMVGFILKPGEGAQIGTVASVIYAFSAVLAVAGMFMVQRLHERKRYRAKQIRKVTKSLAVDFPVVRKINTAPRGRHVTKMIWERRGWKSWSAKTLGSFSSTATGCALLFVLFVILTCVGIITGISWGTCPAFLLTLIGGASLVIVVCWVHHRWDKD